MKAYKVIKDGKYRCDNCSSQLDSNITIVDTPNTELVLCEWCSKILLTKLTELLNGKRGD